MRHATAIAMFVALATLSALPAGATWSIVAADVETQEIVVASATCLTGFDLKAWLPAIVVGKGGGRRAVLRRQHRSATPDHVERLPQPG